MQIAFAVFLFVHGFAHIVGFLTVSGLMTDESMSGEPFLVGGHEPGSPLMWVLAVVWLALAGGFVFAGVAVLIDAWWALTLMVAVTAVSMVLSLIWVRQAPFGMVANVIVIAALVIPWVSERVLP